MTDHDAARGGTEISRETGLEIVRIAARLNAYIAETMQLASLAVHALRAYPLMMNLLAGQERLGIEDRPPQFSTPEWTRKTAAESDFVKRLEASGYSLLNNSLLVSAWGSLEAAVHDMAIVWMKQDEALFTRPAVASLKFEVRTLLGIPDDERAEIILDALERQRGASRRLGVGQFEDVLADLGIGGSVDQRVRRAVLVAQQMRHLVAHRNGVVDKPFLERTGLPDYEPGGSLHLSTIDLTPLISALSIYGLTVASRFRYPGLMTAPPVLQDLIRSFYEPESPPIEENY